MTSGKESPWNFYHFGTKIIENGQFGVELWYFLALRWIIMVNHGYPCLTMDIHCRPCISMVNHGYPWLTMDIHGYPWIYMVNHGYPLFTMDIMVHHGYPWLTIHILCWKKKSSFLETCSSVWINSGTVLHHFRGGFFLDHQKILL